MKKILFLDIETTGLPAFKEENQMPAYFDLQAYDRCRMLQIGGVRAFEDGERISNFKYFVKPEFEFFNDAENINQITETQCKKYGFELVWILEAIEAVTDDADIIVIQKSDFDSNVILSEFERFFMEEGGLNEIYAKSLFPESKIFCTKKFFTKYFDDNKIPYKSQYGASLNEIFRVICNKQPTQRHDALVDAEMLYEIYFDAKIAQIL